MASTVADAVAALKLWEFCWNSPFVANSEVRSLFLPSLAVGPPLFVVLPVPFDVGTRCPTSWARKKMASSIVLVRWRPRAWDVSNSSSTGHPACSIHAPFLDPNISSCVHCLVNFSNCSYPTLNQFLSMASDNGIGLTVPAFTICLPNFDKHAVGTTFAAVCRPPALAFDLVQYFSFGSRI